MGNRDKAHEPGRQDENSRQSSTQGAPKRQGGRSGGKDEGTGIGSSQGQDRASPADRQERSDRGRDTPDIERGAQPGAPDSLTNEMTGAFKERP